MPSGRVARMFCSSTEHLFSAAASRAPASPSDARAMQLVQCIRFHTQVKCLPCELILLISVSRTLAAHQILDGGETVGSLRASRGCRRAG